MALSLAKPRYHLSYAAVIVAALLFGPSLDNRLAGRLVVLFLSFNVLLYTGIYIFNDVADVRADAAHARKRERPIASGRIAIRKAVLAGMALVVGGLLSATIFFPPSLVAAFVLALLLNVAYSGGGRNLPYVDIALNGAPHALRFLMGALLVGRVPPLAHLLSWFCLAAGVACVRRLVELESGGLGSRPSLRHYTPRGLSRAADVGLFIIVALCALDRWQSPGFYVLTLSAYLLMVLMARRITVLHGRLAWLWLR